MKFSSMNQYNQLSRGNLVPPIAVSGEVLEAPDSLLNQSPAWGRWVWGHAVGVVFGELSWISWFISWMRVEYCALRASKMALILSSINSSEETPLKVPPTTSVPRVSDVSVEFSTLTELFECKIWLWVLQLLRGLQSWEKIIQLLKC